MIDELTIAANNGLEGALLGKQTGTGGTAPRLSSVFGDLLQRSASSAAQASTVSAMVATGDEPPTATGADSAVRDEPDEPDDPDDPDDFADRDLTNGGDTVRPAGREDVPPDHYDVGYHDRPVDSPEPVRTPVRREETRDAVSISVSETEAEAIGDGTFNTDRLVDPRHGPATSANPGSRGPISVQTPVTAQPGDTVVPLDESLLKAARTAPQRPPEAKPEQAARTALPAEATAAIRQQAAGLTKAVGDGGRTHVSVNVAKEADTPASQPSVTLAAAAAPLVDGARPNQRPHAKAAQADAGPGGPLHPTAARAQPQTARGQQTPPTLPPRPGAAAQAPSAGAFTTTVAGSPVASTETGEDDLIGLAGTTDNPRGTGPVTARTNGGGKLSAHHRSVVDQISVNVGKAVKAGIDRIEIRLRPENLGRVEVRLEVHHDGRVTAAVTADNRDTLELLKSDARGLERALQDAGLKADSGSLSFSLRGHDTAARHGGGSIPNPPAAEIGDGVAEDGDDPSASRNTAYPQGGILPDGRIDIRA